MHYADDGIYLLSGGEDGTINAWDIDSAELVSRHKTGSLSDETENSIV